MEQSTAPVTYSPLRPNTTLESVSIILPTYNERENIQRLIPELEKTFQGYPLEILVVDDASPDGTAAAAEALNPVYGNIRVLRRECRAGLGSAIRRGYDEARHDLLISCDSDGSFLPQDLLRLLKTAEQGYDLVLGSRHSPGGSYETPRWTVRLKYGISSAGNWVLRAATGLKLHDYSANCRVVRKKTWQALHTTEQRNVFLLEMVLRAAERGSRMTEIPVAFQDRRYGRSKLNLWVEVPKYLTVLGVQVVRYWIAVARRKDR